MPLEAMKTMTEEQVEAMRDRGRFPFINKTMEEMETIAAAQLAGLKRDESMTQAAEERHLVEGPPHIKPDHVVWDCKGGECMFQCSSSLTFTGYTATTSKTMNATEEK